MNKYKHGDIVQIQATSYSCTLSIRGTCEDILLGYVWENSERDEYGGIVKGYLIIPLVVGYSQKIAFSLPNNHIPNAEDLVFANEEWCYDNTNYLNFVEPKQGLLWRTNDWYYDKGEVKFI